MNKLFKSVHSIKNNHHDELIKKSITTQLANTVKEIQYCGIEENCLNKSDDITEAANNLCTVIEAIFLHGLKDSLSNRFRRAIADLDERPEPNFWAPLLVISHRQIIDQITNLTRITSEVGQCRAWIRLALNDCLLSSYLMTMRQDSAAIKSFYKTGAYIRDHEILDVAQHLIEGVETVKTFTLPYNSSLLNTWPLPSLYLAGIWAPTLKTCPVAPCDDVAQSLLWDNNIPKQNENSSNSETCSLNSAMSITSENSTLRQMVALNEDEVLKIILAKPNNDKNEQQSSISSSGISKNYSEMSDAGDQLNNLNLIGNSLMKRTGGWSFDENQKQSDEEIIEIIDEDELLNAVQCNNKNIEPKSMEGSFNALIESYNLFSGNYIKTPDLREVWQKFEDQRLSGDENSSINNNPEEESEISAVENVDVLLSKSDSLPLTAQIGQIAKEKGLDYQNYECASCSHPLGINQKPNVCAFTGEYFCNSCMSTNQLTIPARIIHNWDFKIYQISLKAFNYINDIKDNPTIDLKILNPFIYGVIEEFAELQILRTQLNFLRAYLYTCRENVIEEFQKKIWPREYMYEHIHLYSISDLTSIKNGSLIQHLQTVVDFGREHVIGCWLCSQKGFVCEVCNKPKALFPFDVKNVYRCEICNAVYHQSCLNSSKPCPKCERRKKREDLPLLGATVE